MCLSDVLWGGKWTLAGEEQPDDVAIARWDAALPGDLRAQCTSEVTPLGCSDGADSHVCLLAGKRRVYGCDGREATRG